MVLALHALMFRAAASTAACAALAAAYCAFSAAADAARYAEDYAEGNEATQDNDGYDWPSMRRECLEDEQGR